MCILIVSKKGALISEDEFKNCSKSNPDGTGWAYSYSNKVTCFKTYEDRNKIKELYNKYTDDCKGRPHILHFRIATIGDKCQRLAHPFKTNNGGAFAHNGTFSSLRELIINGDSDTLTFGKLHLDTIINITEESLKEIESKCVSSYCKVAWLQPNGEIHLFGEKLGHYKDEVWFSNNSYKPYVYKPSIYSPYLPVLIKKGNPSNIKHTRYVKNNPYGRNVNPVNLAIEDSITYDDYLTENEEPSSFYDDSLSTSYEYPHLYHEDSSIGKDYFYDRDYNDYDTHDYHPSYSSSRSYYEERSNVYNALNEVDSISFERKCADLVDIYNNGSYTLINKVKELLGS